MHVLYVDDPNKALMILLCCIYDNSEFTIAGGGGGIYYGVVFFTKPFDVHIFQQNHWVIQYI